MTSKDPKKAIDNLENQKVDSDKITGGGKQVPRDMGWTTEKNKFGLEAKREHEHNPAGERGRGKGKKGIIGSSNNPLEGRN